MGSLITREKGYIRTQKTHRNMHGHACTGVDIFSPLHCSLCLAHLHITGSRTHYQLGEMKGAHGGRRTRGGGMRSGGKRKKAVAEAGSLTQPPHLHITTVCGRNLNSLSLTPLTLQKLGMMGMRLSYFFLLTHY